VVHTDLHATLTALGMEHRSVLRAPLRSSTCAGAAGAPAFCLEGARHTPCQW
jgi:hypothetical protein